LAADTGIRVVKDKTADRVLPVRIHRAALQAGRLDAMIAAHRQKEPLRIRINSAFEFSYATPLQVRRIIVLLVAGYLTAVAADAARHVEVESILLAGGGRSIGDPAFRRGGAGVRPGETVGTFSNTAEDSVAFYGPCVQW
jgi:hypothetical protein